MVRTVFNALIFVFIVVILSSSLLIFAPKTSALEPAGPCPAGTVPVTDRKAAHDAGIPDSSPCWNPTDVNAGQNVGQAKEFLRSILCKNSNYGGAGPDGTIQGLDAKFAVCAASFLKSAQSNGIPVCVNEGYRTVQTQNTYAQRYLSGQGGIACTRGAACEHPRGIAIDVNTSPEGNYQRLHNAALSFGLIFYIPQKDPVHFVPQKGGCSSGGNIPPGGSAFPTAGHNENLPASAFDFPQQYSAAMASQTPPPPFPEQQLPPSPNQNNQMNTNECFTSLNPPTIAQAGTVPQSQCLTSGQTQKPQLPPPQQQPPQTPQQPQSSSPNQPSQPSQSSTSVTPDSSLLSIDNSSSTSPISDLLLNGIANIGTGNSTTSAIDLINMFADGMGSTGTGVSIGTATPIAINSDTSDNTDHLSGTANSTTTTIIMARPLPPTPVAQQTFTSPDLANTPVNPQNNTFTTSLLETLKDSLIYALNYLKPFGGVVPSQTYAE